MKIKYNTLIVLSIALSISCSKSGYQSSDSSDYEVLAEEKYGSEQTTFINSEDGHYVLCKHKMESSSDPYTSWAFFVFDLNSKKIVLEDMIDRGNVKWFSNHQLETSQTPGTMATNQTKDDYAWIVNVESGEKIKKSKYNQR